MAYRARHIVVDSQTILEDVILTIQGGRVLEVSAQSRQPCKDLGDVLVLPGFVNAHTHLDLSAVNTPIPADRGMADWLDAVVKHRRASSEAPNRAVELGIAQSIEAGTAIVGDITTLDVTRQRLAEAGLTGVVYREVIGLKPERYEPLWQSAVHALDGSSPLAGLTPHAPYSTSRDVYRRCWKLPNVPLATHWMESPEELEFLATGRGPLREFLERLGALGESWAPVADPWSEYLSGGRWNLVHANYLREQDGARLRDPTWRERMAAITYCPRTHAHFGHPPHPWRELLEAGIPVALGTDSLASNPDLSVLVEARWLAARHPEVSPATFIDMLTIHGARALGLERDFGTLHPGKSATMTLFASNGRNPLDDVLDPAAVTVGLMVEGRWLRWPPGH